MEKEGESQPHGDNEASWAETRVLEPGVCEVGRLRYCSPPPGAPRGVRSSVWSTWLMRCVTEGGSSDSRGDSVLCTLPPPRSLRLLQMVAAQPAHAPRRDDGDSSEPSPRRSADGRGARDASGVNEQEPSCAPPGAVRYHGIHSVPWSVVRRLLLQGKPGARGPTPTAPGGTRNAQSRAPQPRASPSTL